jgi:hypothetical protein
MPGCATAQHSTLQKMRLRTRYATQEFLWNERSSSVAGLQPCRSCPDWARNVFEISPLLVLFKGVFWVVSRGWTPLESEECNLIFRVRTWQSVDSPWRVWWGERMLMRARCFPNIKQLPSARRSTEEFPKWRCNLLKDFHMQMQATEECLYQAAILDCSFTGIGFDSRSGPWYPYISCMCTDLAVSIHLVCEVLIVDLRKLLFHKLIPNRNRSEDVNPISRKKQRCLFSIVLR